MKRLKVVLVVACLLLSSCASVDPFAGNWQGSGVDSQGNEYTFGSKVIALGDNKYRVLILDKLDTEKEPMHIMDGTLEGDQFPYTSDGGVYTGGGTLKGDTFEGWYKGPVDGTYTMQRVVENRD